MKMKLEMSGRYKAWVERNGAITQETEWFDNLITDRGLDLLGTGHAARCYAGSGTSEPVASSCALSRPYSFTASEVSDQLTPNQEENGVKYGANQRTYRFGIGQIHGPVSEAGIGNSTTDLFSHALLPHELLLDGDVDRLYVIYELRQCIPEGTTSHTMLVDGVSHSCEVTPHEITIRYWVPSIGNHIWERNASGSILHRGNSVYFVDGTILEGSFAGLASQLDPYVMGSYERWMNHIAVGPGKTGEMYKFLFAREMRNQYGLRWCNGGRWEAVIDPPIALEDHQRLVVQVGVSWARCAGDGSALPNPDPEEPEEPELPEGWYSGTPTTHDGGPGRLSEITGTPTYYGGGGAAGYDDSMEGHYIGGLGGGGSSETERDGVDGLGGGGCGGDSDYIKEGGAGGSGVAIIRYPAPQRATGGSVTTATIDGTDYIIHTLSATEVFENSEPLTLDFLLVGGGAAGGYGYQWGNAGGGGGGGVREFHGLLVPAGSHDVVVGLGGAPVHDDYGEDGQPTSAFNYEAAGGGGGALRKSRTNRTGRSGGCGGGGSRYATGGAGNVPATDPVQGFDGFEEAGGGAGFALPKVFDSSTWIEAVDAEFWPTQRLVLGVLPAEGDFIHIETWESASDTVFPSDDVVAAVNAKTAETGVSAAYGTATSDGYTLTFSIAESMGFFDVEVVVGQYEEAAFTSRRYRLYRQ